MVVEKVTGILWHRNLRGCWKSNGSPLAQVDVLQDTHTCIVVSCVKHSVFSRYETDVVAKVSVAAADRWLQR